MTTLVTRRTTLIMIGAAVASLGGPVPSFAAKEDFEAAVAAFTGGKEVVTGKVTLTLPEIAENGNTVPLTVAVESPMTADDYCQSVLILADGNPRSGVGTFHFFPGGIAEATTRIRLASTQNVVAIAKMSNGTFARADRQVKVTIGGCGG